MRYEALSIDPSGEWSPRKAARVLEVINPEARQKGVFFQAIDVSVYNNRSSRVLLIAYCVEHEIAVGRDSHCMECVRHAPKA